ncbi:MAG: glycosyltransferase family 9 protein [Proteobacteria bacterium]|nr:glycosyltransferase family 9 protein [Pseudomonadota bacterium]
MTEPELLNLTPAVVRFGRLGDMVMLTALLGELHARYGRPCLVVGAGPWNEPLLTGHPDVAQVFDLPRHSPFLFSGAAWRALCALRRSAPGPVYVCEYQPRQVPRIRRLLKWGGIDPRRCLYITDPPGRGDEPWVQRLVSFGQETPPGLPAGRIADAPAGAAPQLYAQAADVADLEGWLAAAGLAGHPLVLVQTGNFRTLSRHRERYQAGGADDKAWPLERWVELTRRISAAQPRLRILLCGAPQEGPMLRKIAQAAANPAVSAAELPLRRLLALCTVAQSMISIDTGPAHVAAACGLPLLVLYGAEDPKKWLPRGPRGSVVRSLGGPPASTRVDALDVEQVLSAWQALPPRSRGA